MNPDFLLKLHGFSETGKMFMKKTHISGDSSPLFDHQHKSTILNYGIFSGFQSSRD